MNKVDYATLKYPFIGNSIIKDWNYDVTGGTWTATENCYVVGKAVAQGPDSRAYVNIQGVDGFVGGIPYISSSSMFQVAFCFPLAKGQTLEVITNNNGRIQGMTARKMALT